MSYKNLQIYQLARELVVEIHNMTLNELPRFEMYEEGNQIRRSIKSVKSNIVEGYGRRKYPKEFIRFIIFSLSSNDETLDHLDTLYETGSLKNKELYLKLDEKLNILGRKLNRFLQSLEKQQCLVSIQ